MKIKFAIACSLFLNFCYPQHGANQLYQNENGYNYASADRQQYVGAIINKITTTQSEVFYKLNILNNVKADSYLITFGLNEEALTIKDCNAKINKRIAGFRLAMKKMGIADGEIFTDFISQTKIYDYKSETAGSQINVNQVEKGFEIKKNLIVRLKNSELFDGLIETASEYEIHNIVKVDYFNLDTQKIYNEMLAEAAKILEARRKQSKQISDPQLDQNPQLTVNFYSIQPGSQYKNYTAYESSDVSYYNNYNTNTVFVKKEQRKGKTFYYDGRNPDLYDKIMNADTPVVGLQYVMEISVAYRR